MKQKRKVKSLISSTNGNSLWLTLLLFLLGGILCFGAVTLFTSSVGVHAAEDPESRINYPGIEDKHEVLLKFGLIPEGGINPVNEMYLTGSAFFMSGTAGISVNNNVAQIKVGKYINYLLGENRGSDWIEISSDNITLIGGSNIKVSEKNDNTAILGGIDNEVSDGNEKAAPVMLGGQGNKITVIQEGSAIVGGEGNKISGEGSYDFILGGNANEVRGSNVIVGGARVNINNKSDLFAFSYGDAGVEFSPEKGNTFYLNLKHGLGLNEAAANTGVHSKGAVSFGEVDIVSVSCTTADEGVQGVWEGCLVGCTHQSATGTPSGRWEMIDHGTGCAKKCTDNSNDCMINPINSEGKTPYTAYCTTNGVDTGNAIHCGGEDDILPRYNNVIFETVLIDSNIPCPQPGAANWTENRCVFKCEGGSHLRVDETVTNGDGRMRCYKDCELPWPGAEPLKHNETVTAYKRENAYCSNDAGTAPIRDSCKNYKATLVCQNGTLYVANGDGKTASANTASSQGYEFSGCMLHQYRCPTTTYNYEKSQITTYFNDSVSNWNISDRGTLNGQRGKYKLCVDYDTQGNKIQYQNGEQCDALNKQGNSYLKHYQWLGCQNHYHTGSWDGGHVCRADCSLINRSTNRSEYFPHQTTRTACKTKSESCENGAGRCDCTTLVCDDGKWKKNGVETNEYKYTDCVLNNFNCSTTNYNVTEAEKTAHQPESIYGESCDSYKGESDKVTCTKTKTDYKLTNCLNWDRETGFHTEDNKFCISNYDERDCTKAGVLASLTMHWRYIVEQVPAYWHGTAYNVGSWETPDCAWECYPNNNYHLEDGDCQSNTRGVDCNNYYAADLPNNAHWRGLGVQTWNGAWNNGRWLDPARNSCVWDCDDGYVESNDGTSCEQVMPYWPSPDGCACGYYDNGNECVACDVGEYSAAGSTSCNSCTNRPSNSHYTSNACSNSCNWACDPGYTKSGNSCIEDEPDPISCNCGYYDNNGTCTACGAKKYSSAGASSCSTADVGYYANSSCSQTACTNKPEHSHYTSNASTNDCSWECDSEEGYYLNESGDGCKKSAAPQMYLCTEDGGPSNSHYLVQGYTYERDCPWECDCGYYENGNSCTACGAKKYSEEGASSCSTASIGYYANSSCSQTACTNKPSNSSYISNASSNSCDWACNCGYYKNGSSCSSCGVGTYSSAGSTSCTNCTNKPSNSHYTSNACGNSCSWECDPGYHKSGNSCVEDDEPLSCDCSYYNDGGTCKACATGKYSAAGSTSCTNCTNKPSNSSYTSNACTNSCSWQCNCGYYKNGSSCSSCGVGTYSSAGSTSCTNCTNKPSNSHYTSNACGNSCSWECDPGYHKSGNSCVVDVVSCNCGYYNNGGTCTACGAKKYSSAGATSCETADVGYYANSSCNQTACTNKPLYSHYTSNASSNNCSWECDSPYYKLNAAGNGCVPRHAIACGAAKYTCTSDGSYTVNEKPSTATHYVWDCIGEDESAYDCKAEIPGCTYDERDKEGCTNPHPSNVAGNWNSETCACECPDNSSFDGELGCVCNNGYQKNGNSCVLIANYSIELGSMIDDEKLCSGPITEQQYYGGVRYTTAYDACRAHEGDCYADYYDGVDVTEGHAGIFSCQGIYISSCGTSDYQSYCNNNPGGVCYISSLGGECNVYSYVLNNAYCSDYVPAAVGCGAVPGAGIRYYERSCTSQAYYLQCK